MSQLREFYNDLMTEHEKLVEVTQSQKMFISNKFHVAKFLDDIIAKSNENSLELNADKIKQVAMAAVIGHKIILGNSMSPDEFVRMSVNLYNERLANEAEMAAKEEERKKKVVHDFDDNRPWAKAILNKNVTPTEEEQLLQTKLAALRKTGRKPEDIKRDELEKAVNDLKLALASRQRGESVE